MAKGKNALTKPTEIPSYLVTETAAGLEDKLNLGSTTPRLYVVQAQTKNKELRQEHGVGALLIGEGDEDFTLVASADETVEMAPLCRWLSWAKIKDKDDQSDTFWIVEEVLDHEHLIAVAAGNRDLWFADYEDGSGMKYRNVENINFLFAILSGPCTGRIVAYTFSKGGWKYGRKLNTYLERRGISIYGNRIHGVVHEAENKNGDNWMQFQHEVATDPFVSEEQAGDLARVFEDVEAMRRALGAVQVADQQK